MSRVLRLVALGAAAALCCTACLGGDDPGDPDAGRDLVLSGAPVTFQVLSLAEWAGRLDPVRVSLCRPDLERLRAVWPASGCSAELERIEASFATCDARITCEPPEDGDPDTRHTCTLEGDSPCTFRVGADDADALPNVARVNVGGALGLGNWWAHDRARLPDATFILSTGDAFGASPPLAAFFEEEPVVRALNVMGLDADTVGNHNFDRGLAHLQQMLDLSDFHVLVANLTRVPQNVRGVAPYTIADLGGMPVAFIGVTDTVAPDTVFPGSFGTMTVTDPLAAVLEARSLAEAAGARYFVVIAHLGVDPLPDDDALMPDARPIEPQGSLMTLWLEAQAQSNNGFDLFIGRGAPRSMLCTLPRDGATTAPECSDFSAEPRALELDPDTRVLVQGRGYGESYVRVEATAVPASGALQALRVSFELPELCTASERIPCDVPTLEALEALLEPYRQTLAETRDVPIGQSDAELPFREEELRSSSVPLGHLVADALRERADASVAVFNAGGIRSGLPSDYQPLDTTLHRSGTPPLTLVRGDIDTVLPFFPSTAVTLEVSAADLYATLEQSVSSVGGGGFLQISGMRFVYAPDAPAGSRVCRVVLDEGGELARDGADRVVLATIDFLAQGGDGYLMLSDKAHVTRGSLQEMLIAHIESLGTVSLETLAEPRITRLAAGQTCADADRVP